MSRFVISGWYGPKNLGDEVILLAIINKVVETCPDAKVTVLSFNPRYTRHTHKVKAVRQIPSSFLGWLRAILSLSIFFAIYEIYRCDVFIMGGGGFISDWQADVPKNWLKQMKLAKFFKKKTMIYGMGMGPFNTQSGQATVRHYLTRYVDRITVRDDISRDWLVQSGVDQSRIFVTKDPVYGLSSKVIQKKEVRAKCVLLSFPPLFHNEKWENHKFFLGKYIDSIERLVKYLKDEGIDFKFISMMPGDDDTFARDYLQADAVNINCIDDLVSLYERYEAVAVGVRFHFNLISVVHGIPTVPVVYHHKVKSMVDGFGLKWYCEVGNGQNWRDVDLDAESLFDHIKNSFSNYDLISEGYLKILPVIREAELKNSLTLNELINEQ